MKKIGGVTLGGLQQKILNLLLIFVIVMIAVFIGISVYQQKNLTKIVTEASAEQQASIKEVSEATMEGVLNTTMVRTTALQAYIADDLFKDVRTDVATLQTYAEDLFAHADRYTAHPVSPPSKANDGVPSVQVVHEPGVDPASSRSLGLIANMSEVMLSMFTNSEKLNSCFIATTDGNLLFVNDRAGEYLDENGNVRDFPVRERPWYLQAVEAGKLTFTGVELDAFTNIPGLVCTAPVYYNGQLVAVIGADVFLTSISDYVNNNQSEGSFVCVVNGDGQLLFSPVKEGVFEAQLAKDAPDLRKNENKQLAAFVTKALSERTGLETVELDGKSYYMVGAPMESVGWAAISVVDQEVTHKPTEAMLTRYEEINNGALESFQKGVKQSMWTFIVTMVVLLILAIVSALVLSGRIVKPLEHMTKRMNTLSGSDGIFRMEKIYRTKDEIEVLAESFAMLSRRTQDYIKQITEITAEKERIGTELQLATRIQMDMLPNIYPAFPERDEFDIYASMDPAREVGGDFYDFFLIDDDHLYMLIADVSGKGIPAALFMMASRIVLANFAMMGKSPAEILTSANDAICQNNPEEMFVTVWLGILELSTGKIKAANAGHEYPVIMQPDGQFELVKDKHGLVIGGMEGVKYKEYDLQIAPGGKLFVYTDGVPEATNAENELFGTDRMLAALNEDTTVKPDALLKQVRKSVDAFVGDAEQFDDLTMLAVEYKGGTKK